MTDSAVPGQRRGIRSFVRREGRMTAAQAQALVELLPAYSLADPFTASDLGFLASAPLGLEIGCGNGEFLLSAAQRDRAMNFLGVEVHRPGVGQILRGAHTAALTNLRVSTVDIAVLLDALPPSSVTKVFIFFPDPWPKSRHHKRRLLQTAFFSALHRVVAGHGRVFIATDVADYADFIYAQLHASPMWNNLAGRAVYAPRYRPRGFTRFETRGLNAGRAAREFVLSPRQ